MRAKIMGGDVGRPRQRGRLIGGQGCRGLHRCNDGLHCCEIALRQEHGCMCEEMRPRRHRRREPILSQLRAERAPERRFVEGNAKALAIEPRSGEARVSIRRG
ncbi:MAG: hypothetical protein BroJett013_24990 [Alphaproteobacteria bacterium]|nr:MAG: hypothetical protein BroJett013_24990 [Alphaproteobacteria bacterium]